MIIVERLDDIPDIKNAVVTSGTFDGVHYGHKKILKHVVKTAKTLNGKSVVLTFWPHPRFVLHPEDQSLKLLSTFEEKAYEFEQIGIDYVLKIEFTKSFSELSSEQFIQSVLVDRIQTKKLIIGYDHRFGKNREGSFSYLKENSERWGFEVEEISRQDIDDVAVSSTKIRNALNEGDVKHANEYLERAYALTGRVVKGQQLGTSLGFPTANIKPLETYKQIPSDGVYAVHVFIDAVRYRGMLNIGERPTVSEAGKAIEVNIFEFDQEIYGEKVEIQFVQRLRNEAKFSGLEDLKKQLGKDKDAAIAVLSKQ